MIEGGTKKIEPHSDCKLRLTRTNADATLGPAAARGRCRRAARPLAGLAAAVPGARQARPRIRAPVADERGRTAVACGIPRHRSPHEPLFMVGFTLTCRARRAMEVAMKVSHTPGPDFLRV